MQMRHFINIFCALDLIKSRTSGPATTCPASSMYAIWITRYSVHKVHKVEFITFSIISAEDLCVNYANYLLNVHTCR